MPFRTPGPVGRCGLSRDVTAPGFAVAVAMAVVFQGGVFLLETATMALPVNITVLGAMLAFAGVGLAAGGWRGRLPVGRFIVLCILWLGALGLFIPFLATIEVPLQARLLSLAAILAHGTAAVILVLWVVRLPRLAESALTVGSLAAALFMVEVALEPRMSTLVGVGPSWDGPLEADDELGLVYPPYSEHRAYYPDNPRGYFKVEDLRQNPWRLRTTGARAELVEGEVDLSRVGIRIHEGGSPDGSLQVNQVGLSIRAGGRYHLSFQARADRTRQIAYGVGTGSNPLDGLGTYLHEVAELTTEPRVISSTFVASGTSHNAHIRFDLGVEPGTVTLTDIRLAQAPGFRPLEPPLTERFFVSYDVNGHGCRDRDYEVPRPADTWRILMLGDSYVMGLGVHEEDVISRRMERILNDMAAKAGAGERYEVINCGVSGFSTRDERIFYERLTDYDPQIVVLGMVGNDDRSWLEDVRLGHFYLPGRADHLSGLWNLVRRRRRSPPPSSFEGSLAEVRQLDEAVRARGGRLAVFVFRNFLLDDDPKAPVWWRAWADLVNTMRAGLEGTDIPFIDAGEDMLAEHTEQDLLVHSFDLHPNEIGHALAADAVLRMLTESGLLPLPEVGAPVPTAIAADPGSDPGS
jgi:hypothetical protein